MNCLSNNGRVDIMGPNVETQFAMQDKIPVDDCTSFSNAMTGNWNDTPLSVAFFSADNIRILQNGIRSGVFDRSKGQYVIGLQDCDTLKIIMRSTFLQSSNNQPRDLKEQIAALNNLVLNYCIPQVYGEAQGYIHYKKDVSTMAVPIERPTYADYNDKTLELKPWF